MVRSLLLLLFVLSCSPSMKTRSTRTLASGPEKSREEAHAQAVREFDTLNFFADGRGMMISPGLIDLYDRAPKVSRNILTGDIFGFNVVDGEVKGLLRAEHEGYQIGVLGCVACHSGKAAGQYIVGLGNKKVDVFQVGTHTLNVSKAWKLFNLRRVNTDDDYRGLTEDSIAFAKTLASKDYSNLTQGLVPTGVIRTWFYRQAGKPIPKDLPRAAVKVPHLWGYGVKRKIGSFSDGGGNGNLPGWAVAVELVANQRPETIRSYQHKIEHAEDLLGSFLPPAYPFKIDDERARAGKIKFEQTCAKCHGTYERDADGLQVYAPPKWIPIERVKTDEDRLQNLNVEFLQLVRSNPLKDILIDNYKGRGYFAPRLDGVWARFPYLHNASVPTIHDLLQPQSKRPKYFSLRNSGERHRFDEANLGLKLSPRERLGLPKLVKPRYVYDVTRQGQSNQGHEFYTDMTADEKAAVIEYLKTL